MKEGQKYYLEGISNIEISIEMNSSKSPQMDEKMIFSILKAFLK